MVWKYSLVVRLSLSAWPVHTHLHCQQVGRLSTNLHGPEENFCEVDCKCTVTHSVSKTPGALPPFCYLDIALGYHVTTLEYIDLLKTTFIRNVYSSLWPLRDTTLLYLCWEGGLFVQSQNSICSAGVGQAPLSRLVSTASLTQTVMTLGLGPWANTLAIRECTGSKWQPRFLGNGGRVLTGRLSPPFSIKWEPQCWCSLPVSLCCVVLPVSLCCLAPQTWNFASHLHWPFVPSSVFTSTNLSFSLKLLTSKWIVS